MLCAVDSQAITDHQYRISTKSRLWEVLGRRLNSHRVLGYRLGHPVVPDTANGVAVVGVIPSSVDRGLEGSAEVGFTHSSVRKSGRL